MVPNTECCRRATRLCETHRIARGLSDFGRIAARFDPKISGAIGNGVWLMTAKAGLIPVAAMLLTGLLGTGFSATFAGAENACLEAPNAPAPQGSRWYYRTDPSTQHKCWYTRPPDQAAQAAPAQQDSKPAMAEAAPSDAAPKPAHDRAASDKLAHRVLNAFGAPGSKSPTGSQAKSATWTDPAPPAATVAWPDPPALPVDDTGANQEPPSADPVTQTAPSTPAAASASPAPAAAPTAAKPAQDGAAGQPANDAAVDPSNAAASPSDAHAGMILAGFSVLLIAGVFVRRMVAKAFKPRRAIRAVRREPVLIAGKAGREFTPTLLTQSPTLVPGHADCRIEEIEDALRKLGQRLHRRRSTPFKTAPPLVSAAVRVRPQTTVRVPTPKLPA
jgi:hypothetical protein